MAYTGYLIIQYIDENPNSPTYGETWTERQLDTTHCPADGGGEWELISTFCESDTSGYTGNRINTYYNSVTGEYSSTTAPDASCSTSTFDELWVNSGDVYCEITEEGIYTGWGIQLQVQRNSNLLNYGETREVRVANASCSAHTEPIWQTLSTNCHIVTDELTCYLTYDGTADLLQIDNNPSSPTFNQTRTITGESEECQCEACDRIEYEWRFIDDICGIQMPSKYGLTGLTDDTVYHVYRQYGTCIIEGQSGRTKPTNVYSAVTYQTGVSDCMYRWVETDDTVCVEEEECNCSELSNNKLEITIDTANTYSLSCGTSSITETDVHSLMNGHLPSGGYDINIQICNCTTSIGNNAFYMFGGHGSGDARHMNVCIPNTVTSIGNYAFYCGNKSADYAYMNVTIGSGITSIGNYAFKAEATEDNHGYVELYVTINATTPPTIGTNPFNAIGTNDYTHLRIFVPAESVNSYQSAWPQYASNITAIS